MEGKVYLITTGKSMVQGRNPKGLGLSVLPAIIWSQLCAQKFFESYSGGSRIAATLLVIVAYLVLSQVPYVCLAIAVTNTVMYIGLCWSVLDMIDVMWIRILFKAASVIMIVLMEIGICSSVMGKKIRKGGRYAKTADHAHRGFGN